jgi:hypothetical protein
MDLLFEKGLNYSVEITHEVDGFSISYHAIDFDGLELERTDARLLVERIRKRALQPTASSFFLVLLVNSSRFVRILNLLR